MPQIFRVGPYIIYFWSNENNEPIEKTSKETIEDDIIPNFLEGKNFN